MPADTTSLSELVTRHFVYEVGMLVETSQRLEAGVSDPIVRNALIESFCIHARALVDFFNDRKGAKASAFAESTYVPFAQGQVPRELMSKISKQIAHLSLHRTSDPTKKIGREARQELLGRIAAEMSNFARHLKPEYRAVWEAELKAPSPSVVRFAPSPTHTTHITTTSTTE